MKRKNAHLIVDKLLQVTEDQLFEMSNLVPVETGLKHTIWFQTNQETRHHQPRGKVMVKKGSRIEFYPFSVNEPIQWLVKPAPDVSGKEFFQIAAFVRLNREAILKHWNSQTSSREFLNSIQKL